MSRFSIKKGIDSALNSSGRPLLNIEFLGIGGAFDTEEGTASALFITRAGKLLLIDCGYTAYSKLRKMDAVKKIDRVFVTHTHEDHINGLSTLVYERFYKHGLTTTIECYETVAPRVKQYLDLCGHPEDQYTINTGNVFIEDEGISITKIETTDYHWPIPGFTNSALLFHFDVKDDHAVVIYSGDINIPILDLMPQEDYPFVYSNPDNVFIFHDMTDLEHEQNPHCHFSLLEPVYDKFKNLFTYHHSAEQIANINKVKENPIMAGTSMIVQKTSFCIEETLGL